MPIPNKTDRIIIVGAGVYGLSTTLSLLESGFENVHLFDKNDYWEQQYDYFRGCDSASSDMNKVFRASYGKEVHYQKLALQSRDKFLEWNRMIKEENFENGDPIYFNPGSVHLTDKKELPEFHAATLKAMGKDAILISDPDAEQRAIERGLPAVSVDPFSAKSRGAHLQGVLDTSGGLLLADKACRWVLHLCKKTGNDGNKRRFTTHFGATQGEVKELLLERDKKSLQKKCIGIKTKDGKQHLASVVVVLCGAWTGEIIPEANEKLEATGGTVALMDLSKDQKALQKYSCKRFPSWTYNIKDGAMGGLYGFPVKEGFLKIGYRGIKWTNPVKARDSKTGTRSKVKTAYTEENEANVPLFGLTVIKNFVRENIPEVSSIVLTRICWYSDSEDNDYLITYCPYYADNSLVIGAGDSGHAFKMLGSLGNVIKDIILQKADTDEQKFLAHLFSWQRIREKKNTINSGANDPRALQNLKMATTKDWAIHSAKI